MEEDRKARINRLKWHCRRALLELDLVFQFQQAFQRCLAPEVEVAFMPLPETIENQVKLQQSAPAIHEGYSANKDFYLRRISLYAAR